MERKRSSRDPATERVGAEIKALMAEGAVNNARVQQDNSIKSSALSNYIGGIYQPTPAKRAMLERYFGNLLGREVTLDPEQLLRRANLPTSLPTLANRVRAAMARHQSEIASILAEYE